MRKRLRVSLSILCITLLMPYQAFAFETTSETRSSSTVNLVSEVNNIEITVSVDEKAADENLALNLEERNSSKSSIRAAQNAIDSYVSSKADDPSGNDVYSQYENVKAEVASVEVVDLKLSSDLENISLSEMCGDSFSITASCDEEIDSRATDIRKKEIIYCSDDLGNPVTLEASELADAYTASFDKDGDIGSIIIADVKISSYSTDTAKLEATEKAFELLQNADPESYLDGYIAKQYKLSEEKLQELKRVSEEAVAGCKSDYEKIKAVTAFVADRIYYDYMYYNGVKESTYTDPYDVWKNKITVCAGYARLVNVLLIESGVPCMSVVGSNHEFNAAYDGDANRWVVTDATWCSYNKYTEDGKMVYGGYTLGRFDMDAEKMASLKNHEIYRIQYIKSNDININYSFGLDYYYYYNNDEWLNYNNWNLVLSNVKQDREFEDLSNLVSSVAGIPVTKIRKSTFYETESESIILPDFITEIEEYAFARAKNLKSITLPKELEVLGKYAFQWDESLESIAIPGNVKCLDDYTFFFCEKLKEVILPEGIKEIGDSVFDNCEKLTSIEFPDSLESIGNYAFDECVKLSSIKLPDNLKSIGEYAFSGSKLTTVIIPEKVQSMGDNIFCGCRQLKRIQINCNPPETVSSAFDDYQGIIYYSCKATKWKKTLMNKWCKAASWKKVHDEGKVTRKSTFNKPGNIKINCRSCGYSNNEEIPAVAVPSLSRSSFVYDGTVKTPRVCVYDYENDYFDDDSRTLTYEPGRISVGKYNVTVTLKGNYTGKRTLTFSINPMGTSISSISNAPKAFTIRWDKQTVETTGYQIAYSTSSSFKSGRKDITISNNNITSKKIPRLNAKKKYYVKLRTYKTVNGVKYYSKWSKTKTVITK